MYLASLKRRIAPPVQLYVGILLQSTIFCGQDSIESSAPRLLLDDRRLRHRAVEASAWLILDYNSLDLLQRLQDDGVLMLRLEAVLILLRQIQNESTARVRGVVLLEEVVFIDRTGFLGYASVQAVVHVGGLLEDVEFELLLMVHWLAFLKALEGLVLLDVPSVRVLRELVGIARR